MPDIEQQPLLSTKKVMEITTYSRTTLWRKVKNGEFPAPISLSSTKRAWLPEEIEDWKQKSKEARDKKAAA